MLNHVRCAVSMHNLGTDVLRTVAFRQSQHIQLPVQQHGLCARNRSGADLDNMRSILYQGTSLLHREAMLLIDDAHIQVANVTKQ